MLVRFNMAIFLILFATRAPAHEERHRSPHEAEVKKQNALDNEKEIFNKINFIYEKDVKAIFKIKCMTCHGSSAIKYPFYYNWPIARQIIDSDTKEAKEHINMDNGLPFGGHGAPVEDLEAIVKSAREGSMPPLRYKIMHWGSGLTDEETKVIINWAENSLKLFKK